MITAEFTGTADRLLSVQVSGHAGFAPAGEDIVCAAVSSAVQLTANAITEVRKAPCRVTVLENAVSIVPESSAAQEFLQALYLHLSLLAEEYPGTIHLKISEV